MKTRIPARMVALLGVVLSAGAAGCAKPPPPKAPVVPYEQKLASILRLEDQRILRVPPPPVEVTIPAKGGRRPVLPPPPALPDLTLLIADAEPRVRRRSALAIGRVGLPQGVPPLVATLADADPEVRQMAAFALGLLADASAAAPLTALLTDPVPLVRGRAAEALGSIGAKEAATAIGTMAGEYGRSAAVASLQPDDESWPATPEADAFRLGLVALVRLRAYEPLAAAVLDPSGRPVTSWWPVAFALQRIDDQRAAPALRQLLSAPGRYTPAFAARGLGALKDPAAADVLVPILDPSSRAVPEVLIAAIRAVAAIGAPAATERLAALAADPKGDPNVRLEAVGALASLRAADALAAIQDLMTDEWAVLRAAALRAAAVIDPDLFTVVLSGLDSDRDWSVRAALADVLATLPPEVALPQLSTLLTDSDKRVIPPVLEALTKLRAADIEQTLVAHLKDPDFAVRGAAAEQLGVLKAPAAASALRDAYRASLSDATYAARGAILDALAQYGPAEALETVRAALADKDWAIRVRAVELLAKLEPSVDHREAIRPAPGTPAAPYADPELLAPTYSPHAFVETAKGTIEFELSIVDAPQTARNFMALARKGFFNGLRVHRVVPNFVIQTGDPRGDGAGGPGYTIRDELSDRPYLRGTVGMALDWRDTGGSQFFITHSPQPHLDARYTVFGRVVSGMEVVDRIRQGDVVQRVRVWDGKSW